jgi:hypothetical protein
MPPDCIFISTKCCVGFYMISGTNWWKSRDLAICKQGKASNQLCPSEWGNTSYFSNNWIGIMSILCQASYSFEAIMHNASGYSDENPTCTTKQGPSVVNWQVHKSYPCTWLQVLTDAALLKRQKKEIEELLQKLQVCTPVACTVKYILILWPTTHLRYVNMKTALFICGLLTMKEYSQTKGNLGFNLESWLSSSYHQAPVYWMHIWA